MSKQETLNKLINNVKLTEEEIEWMFEEFEEVYRDFVETQEYHNLIFSVFKVDENLYYGVNWLRSITDYADNVYDIQPFRVKDVIKPVKFYVPYEE